MNRARPVAAFGAFAALPLTLCCLTLSAIGLPAAAAPATAPSGPAADPGPVKEGPRVLSPMEQAEHGIGELAADAAFTDLDGKAGRLADFRGRRATVVCVAGAGCPVAKKYGPTLVELEQRYRDHGVGFLLVNPDANESPERVKASFDALRQSGFAGRYVHDKAGDLARRLGVTSSTEVFVLDGALTLVYRGAINDQYGLGYALPAPRRSFLAEAIDATLAGNAPGVVATTAPGCVLDFKATAAKDAAAAPATPVTYHNRISRLMQRRCQECHRPGESAPFPLATFGDAKDHAAMIRKVVRRGSMPPWFADPKVGHFANDLSLPERDKADLLAWVEAGAPEGDPKDAPLPRTFVQGWQIGKPDAVFEAARPVSVPAKGPIPYQHAVIRTELKEDKWVKAVEIRVAQPQVVHHLLAFVIYPPEDPRSRQQPDFKGGVAGYFAGLVPNQGAMVYPAGTAKLLPKGATLVFQIHYTPDGTAVQDRPKIGFVFADEPPKHEVLTLAAANTRFRIPPGADHHEVAAAYRFKGATRLLSFNPHSHLRGKAFRYELEYPDGRKQTVLDVPRYDYNWQLEYHLRDPIDVPPGAVLRVTAWYDNSDKNPGNPDPTKWVRFGEQTSDEMMIGYFTGHKLP